MPKNTQLNFYDPAPDLTLLNIKGEPVSLSSYWKEQTILLAFTRHFGCTECKEMLEELVAAQDRISAAGLGIVVITQGTPEATALFADRFAPGIPCLSDSGRKAYQAYGLNRGGLFQIFVNTKVWKAIKKAKQKGRVMELPPAGQDPMQMSGTFIVNQEGRILLPFYYDNIADHPALELLLSGVLSTSWSKPFSGPIGSDVE